MNTAAKLRMAQQVARMNARYSGAPDIDDVIADQEAEERTREQRAVTVDEWVLEHLIVDQVEDESLDGGRLTCDVCGLSSNHESMRAAWSHGWVHAQECGGQR